MARFNNLDYAIIAIIGLSALYGLGRGALRILTSILCGVVGLAAASAWYQPGGAFLERHLHMGETASAVVAFVLIFVAVAGAIAMAGRRLVGLIRMINLGWIDRIAGALVASALAAAFVGFDVGLLAAMLPPDSNLVRASTLAPHMIACNETLMAHVPAQVRESYNQKRDALIRYWNGQNENPAHTPFGGSGT
jgi:membrane protein required for colicin V production